MRWGGEYVYVLKYTSPNRRAQNNSMFSIQINMHHSPFQQQAFAKYRKTLQLYDKFSNPQIEMKMKEKKMHFINTDWLRRTHVWYSLVKPFEWHFLKLFSSKNYHQILTLVWAKIAFGNSCKSHWISHNSSDVIFDEAKCRIDDSEFWIYYAFSI